jgi:hypothetical protein
MWKVAKTTARQRIIFKVQKTVEKRRGLVWMECGKVDRTGSDGGHEQLI